MPPALRHLTTLPAAYREFRVHLTPQLLVGELVLGTLARMWWSEWSASDAVVFGVLVGLQPFTEWVIHVFVLHCPADQGLRDRLAGYSHRRHHQDPRDLRFQFIHPRAVYGGVVLNVVVLVAFRTPAALTGVLTATLLTLVYEWVHFLIHTDYSPKYEFYRRLHRAHRLHHFRNEKYWLGVTTRTGDRLLRTNPRKEDVDVTATAKTALAAR